MTPAPKAVARTRCVTCDHTGSARGRKLTVTPELTKRLAAFVASGALAKDAAATVGIGYRAYFEWLRVGGLGSRCPTCGRKIAPQLVQFAQAIEKAKADRRTLLLAKIRKAAEEPKHWTAAAWILERTEGAEFSPRVTHFVRSELEGALDRLESEFNEEPETFERILRCLAGDARSGAPRGSSRVDTSGGGAEDGAARAAPAEPDAGSVPRE
jgi:hypothetical protein